MFEYKIEKILNTVSFDNYQLIVVILSDKNGRLHNGIGVAPGPWLGHSYLCSKTDTYYQPLIIESDQALLFCNFIEEVLCGSIPRNIVIITDGPKFRVHIKKYTENWHGGGGYKGRVDFGKIKFFDIFSNVTIAKSSLISLRNSLMSLYELETNLGQGRTSITD